MKYKIGDKVLVIPRPDHGVNCGWVSVMTYFCNKIVTIKQVNTISYFINENQSCYWSDDCFVGKVVGNKLVRSD